MPRKSKSQLFGVFDEQAISVLVSLSRRKEANFGDLLKETDLSKASLSRVLKRLGQAAIIRKNGHEYAETERGREIVNLTLRIAEWQTHVAITKVGRRLTEMASDYRVERRIFHNDPMWERTGEKALVEVISMRGLTPLESLVFHQRFQEEASREEQKLGRSPATP